MRFVPRRLLRSYRTADSRLHTLNQILTAGIDGNAIISDYDIHSLSRCRHCRNIRTDGGNSPCAEQSQSCLAQAVSDGPCAGNNAVRTDDHITVKVHVHSRDARITKPLIDISALVEWICILGCGYFNMIWIFLDRFNSLPDQNPVYPQASGSVLFQKFTHRSCDTSKSQTHLDTALFHDFAERNRRAMEAPPSDTKSRP